MAIFVIELLFCYAKFVKIILFFVVPLNLTHTKTQIYFLHIKIIIYSLRSGNT